MTDHPMVEVVGSNESPMVVRAAGMVATIVGLTVLIGWILDIELLKTVVRGYGPMEVGTALAFILMGIALNELARHNSRRSRLIVLVAAVTIMLIAGISLAEQFVDLQLGFGKSWSFANHAHTPMSALSGACLMLLAPSLLLASSRRLWTGRLLQGLVLTSMFISGLCLVGYAYDISALFRFDPFASMAIHTAATVVVVCIGLLYVRPDLEVMAPIRSQRLGGLAARTLMPAAVSVPLLLGWVKLQGEVLGLYQIEFGTALHTVSTIIAFAVLVWYCAQTLNEADEQRDLAQQAQRELRILSECDPLTGVLNRRSLAERSERAWALALRHNRPLSCIMVDLDAFKSVNDIHGHASGDAALKAAAGLFVELCRSSDLVARYGGEEFCIIAPETTEEEAVQLAERLRFALARHRINVPAGTLSVTGSFGVAEARQDEDSVDRLIGRADDALLAAKRAGRDCVVVAESPQEGTLSLGVATARSIVEVGEPAFSPCE
jgi:diguanylate cyclase (GGDEF)-like protein